MKIIGLKRLTVKLVPHQKAWKTIYSAEEKKLRKIFPHVEHIGSTAINGIKAKPIIDMLVGIPSIKQGKIFVKFLKRLGYELRPDSSNSRKLFFVKGMESNRTHYLHLVRYNGENWKNTVFFRDYLNENKKDAKSYEKLKVSLVKQFYNTRPMYTKAKQSFIKQVLARRKK